MKLIVLFSLVFSFAVQARNYSSTWERLYYFCKMPAGTPKSAQNALKKGLQKAEYYDYDRLNRINWMMVIDFTQHSSKKRGYLCNLKTGKVMNMWVAHGANSGGVYATRFSNVDGSHKSSLGLYLTKGTYQGKHGLSLYLEGLEPSNDNAYDRNIVMHGASYVSAAWVKKHGYIGRSWGCPAIDFKVYRKVINRLKGGSFIYIHHDHHNRN